MIKKLLLSLFLIAAGVLLLVVSSKLKAKLNDPNMIKTTATIVDILVEGSGDDTSHTTYVEYTLNGETRKAQLNYYSSSMRIGNTEEILVDPGDPSYVYSSSKSTSRALLIPGIMCFVAAVLCLMPRRRVV